MRVVPSVWHCRQGMDSQTTQLPHVRPRAHDKYLRLIDAAQKLPPVVTAVAHPCDEVSLGGAVEARKLRLIEPILVGPPARIREVAARHGIDIAGLPIVEAAHSHDSAAKAVALVREGKAAALMKGSLHTDELMGCGGRPRHRHPHRAAHQPLLRHGCARPSRSADHHRCRGEHRADARGQDRTSCRTPSTWRTRSAIPEVRVAILSAMETVNPKIQSTIEAAALCKMADRGQITGALLDGPLALDNAICPEAAAIKHIVSPVAGRANLLVVPDLEAGNMLAKSLSFLAGADTAGIVLGARVPIILTSRADSLMARLASCAIASMVAAALRR